MLCIENVKLNHLNSYPANKSAEKGRDDLIKQIFAKIFAENEEIDTPSIPFKLIKYISHKNIWGRFLELLIKTLKFGDKAGIKLTTSCYNTAKVLSALIDKDGLWAKSFTTVTTYTHTIKLSSNKEYLVDIAGLFDGLIVCKANANFDEYYNLSMSEKMEKIEDEYLSEELDNFLIYLKPFENMAKELGKEGAVRKQLDQFFREDIDYDFNRSTIMHLKNNLNKTLNLATKNISWFYTIGAVREKYKDRHLFEHTFLLEQFFCKKTGVPRNRIYQSWIEKTTLFDDLEKQSNDCGGEDSWDTQQLESFLNNLEAHYCRKINEKGRVGSKECFGHENTGGEVPLLHFYDQKLSCLSLRYYSVSIDPSKYVENFVDFMSENKINVSDLINLI